MRQPEVARLLALVLALVLALPVAHAGRAALVAAAFLGEFLTGGRLPLLSRVAGTPAVAPLALPAADADLHRAPRVEGGMPLVLVHGFAPEGKDDPRARWGAALLARAGFDVVLPTIPGLTRGRLRPHDVEPVVAAISALGGPTIVVGVSVGAGPALLAAADPRVRDRVSTVLSLGGYASTVELVRFFLTGDYAYGSVRGHVDHDPEVVRGFVAANADLLGPAAAEVAALERHDLAALTARLPPGTRAMLESLSPLRVARDIRARLVLVHGRADSAVPYTESLRLAAARPERTRLVLVGVLEHVEGSAVAALPSHLRDLTALWLVLYGLLVAA